MSDAAAAMGAPTVVSYGGKDYPLSPLSVDMLAMFERWLEDRAFDKIEVRKGQIAQDTYEKLLAAWVEQCASGRFRWGSTVAQNAVRTEDGMAFLLFLQLAERTPAMSQKLAREILTAQLAEIQAKIEVVNAGPFDESAAEVTETPSA